MLVVRVKESAKKRPKVASREMCPHCDQDLEVKTFKKHKSLFLKEDGTWVKNNVQPADDNVEGKQIAYLFQPKTFPISSFGYRPIQVSN